VEWAPALTVVAANTAVIALVVGLQSFWTARSIDALRDELHRGFDRLDARIDHLEQREPPSLRRV
jgi:hypothetical protein